MSRILYLISSNWHRFDDELRCAGESMWWAWACSCVCVFLLQLTCMYHYIKSADLAAFSQYPAEVLIYYKCVWKHKHTLMLSVSGTRSSWRSSCVCLSVFQLLIDWQIFVPLVFLLSGNGQLLCSVQHTVLQGADAVQQRQGLSGNHNKVFIFIYALRKRFEHLNS